LPQAVAPLGRAATRRGRIGHGLHALTSVTQLLERLRIA
jgi:hypothetical protein